MWTLYTKATTYSRLPSEILRLDDEWMAYQFDNAVTLFGTVIENALLERQNTGTTKEPKWESKYTLTELLDSDFRLPRPERPAQPESGIKGLMTMKGVKVHRLK